MTDSSNKLNNHPTENSRTIARLATTYLYPGDPHQLLSEGERDGGPVSSESQELTAAHGARAQTGVSPWENIGYVPTPFHQTESAEEEKEPQTVRELRDKGWLSPTLAEHLYTTFFFLVEAFAKSNPRYRSKDGELFELNVALELEAIAKQANNQVYLPGQKHGAILDRIAKAKKVRNSKLAVRS